MKEQIYTIPVTDAFREDHECALCLLERSLEDRYTDYFLGASLMEPDTRVETNRNGFCRNHFEKMYNRQDNRLGLGLILDTHLKEHIEALKKIYFSRSDDIEKEIKKTSAMNLSDKLKSKKSPSSQAREFLTKHLDDLEKNCMICAKIDFTMERYIDVMFYLWAKEPEFLELFNSKKGFCMVHFNRLLKDTEKYLKYSLRAQFTNDLIKMELMNLERIQREVNWFTEKFDYKNNDAPWGNSRDALPRSLEKIAGFQNLK